MKKILLAFSGFLIGIPLFSQSLSIDPTGIFAKCPNEFINYTVTNTSTAACNYDWTVTNGEILGGSLNGNVSTFAGGTLVQIKWFNTTTSGSVKAVANCTPSAGNGLRTISIPILSINGVNPGSITGASTVTVNVTSNQTYSIPQINFPNIGSGDVNPKEVNSYEWEIPAGWTVVSGGTTKSITVKPDNCSGGNIRVRGKSTTCTNGPFFSNFSPVTTITRTVPTPGSITGPAPVTCSDVSAKTYSVPSATGATSFVWTLPSGWSGSSTTNSITVTPNGLNGGVISVKAVGCGIQSAASSLTIGINLVDPNNQPSVSGYSPVCVSGSTFTISNFPPNSTVTWTQSSNLTTVSGQGTTSYSVRANNSGTKGSGFVEAIITTPCGGALPPIRQNAWVGIPDITSQILYATGSYGVNPVSLAPGNTYYFYMESVPGASFYEWLLPEGFSFFNSSSGNSITELINTSSVEGVYVMGCSAQNGCGTGGAAGLTIEVTLGGGGGIILIVSPNPSSKNQLKVELNKQRADALRMAAQQKDAYNPRELSALEIEYTLVSEGGNEVLHTKTKSFSSTLDIRNTKKGTYILNARYGEIISQTRVIIE